MAQSFRCAKKGYLPRIRPENRPAALTCHKDKPFDDSPPLFHAKAIKHKPSATPPV
jgi:hypothetical protein